MKEFFESQIFALILGASLTLITSIISDKRTYSNSLDEKIVDERISAYKRIYDIISKLNHSLSPIEEKAMPDACYLPYLNTKEGEYRLSFCFPTIFISFETFHRFKEELSYQLNENRIYLNQPVLNKLFLLDQYLGEIWHIANGKDDTYLQMIGFMFMSEIDQLRQAIEKDIQEFFLTGKIKKEKNKFNDAYGFCKAYFKKTELFNLRKDLTSGKSYGEFPLCNNCSHVGDCPLQENNK